MKNNKTHIAIFASGSGTNAQAILDYFKDNTQVVIKCIYSNNPEAYALKRAQNYNIDTFTFNNTDFYHSNNVLDHLQNHQIDLIVLAGFMWLVPKSLVNEYTVINIHPALLPNYGGKGMYGHHVHEAVIKNQEKESGITIHYVNNEYDKGTIILQEKCLINPDDTPDSLADKIHKLEHLYYPITIEKVVQKLR